MRKSVRGGALLALPLLLAASCETLAPGDLMQHAAGAGNLGAVKAYLDSGVPVNYRDANETALSVAARFAPNTDVVKFLLDRGADIDEAVADCQGVIAWGVQNSNPAASDQGTRCVAILTQLKAERAQAQRQAREAAQAQALEAQRAQQMKELVKEVVAATSARQTAAAPAVYSSDIDTPSYKLAERPDDFAIVIGIGKYSDLPEAQFADRDGEAVRDHLLALGFPSRNVVHLTGEKAGYKAIEKFVENWLPKNVDANSRVFFYFSGHGAPDVQSGEAYLLPYDGDPEFLENTGYPLRRLYDQLSRLKVKEVIVALDSCFSGAGGRSVLAKGARPLVLKTEAGAIPENLTVFAATSGDQVTSTLETQGHGSFTYYFLKGLGGAAKDASGAVTVKGLYDYLKPQVQDAARRQNRSQDPLLRAAGDAELARF